MQVVTETAAETEALGEKMGSLLQGGEILALFGPMGMGKTTFTRGVARGLGSNDSVSSPTFALVHEYTGRVPLYHFDMFRVTTWNDLYSTGFFDYLDAGGILAVEWSENIADALNRLQISNIVRPDDVGAFGLPGRNGMIGGKNRLLMIDKQLIIYCISRVTNFFPIQIKMITIPFAGDFLCDISFAILRISRKVCPF